MVHLTLGEWRVACARVTVPEGDLVLACGALATPTESPPQTIPGEGTMLTCTGGALTESPSVVGCHSDGMGCSHELGFIWGEPVLVRVGPVSGTWCERRRNWPSSGSM